MESNKCTIHGQHLDFYCFDCKNEICKGCIRLHTKQKHEVAEYSEYANEMFKNKVEKIKALITENITVLEKQSIPFLKEIPIMKAELVLFKEILEKLTKETTALINSIHEENLLDKKLAEGLNETLEGIVENKTEDIEALAKQLKELEESILLLLNFEDAFTQLKSGFQKLKKQVEATSSLENMVSTVIYLLNRKVIWRLDPNSKHPDLFLSNDNLTVEKINTTGYSSIIGTKGFSKGIHKWKIRVDCMTSCNGIQSHWGCFGVIKKENFATGGNYSSSYSTSTYSQIYNMKGSTRYIPNGVICELALNCDEGTFEIKGKGISLRAAGLKDFTLYPYFELYNPGNKFTLIPP